jgi:hypothetical protein
MATTNDPNMTEELKEGQMLLIETMPFDYNVELIESKGTNETWLEVKGRFQHADLQNQNGRVYPRSLWEKVLSDDNVMSSLKEGAMLGELDHPEDGKTSLKRVSHIITQLQMESTGEVTGRARILNNDHGKQLKEIFAAGGKVGISSRGSGSVKPVNGAQVVQEDFKLNTFDFVVTPSTPNAFPKPLNTEALKSNKNESVPAESDTTQEDYMDSAKKLTELKKEIRSLKKKVKGELNEESLDSLELSLNSIEINLNAMTKDETAKYLAESLLESVQGIRKSLVEKEKEDDEEDEEEEDDDKKKSKEDEEEDEEEFVGDKKASKKQDFMKGNAMGEDAEFDEADMETLKSLMAMAEDDSKTDAQIRLFEADRQSMAMIVNALRNKVKEIVAAQAPMHESLEEAASLREENEFLKDRINILSSMIKRYQESVELTPDAAPASELETAVASAVAEDATFTNYSGYLLESTSKEDFESRKKQILEVEEESIPAKGVVASLRVERESDKAAGASLADRALSILKKQNNTHVTRSGQVMESVKNIK